jgi:hypothetical protein
MGRIRASLNEDVYQTLLIKTAACRVPEGRQGRATPTNVIVRLDRTNQYSREHKKGIKRLRVPDRAGFRGYDTIMERRCALSWATQTLPCKEEDKYYSPVNPAFTGSVLPSSSRK